MITSCNSHHDELLTGSASRDTTDNADGQMRRGTKRKKYVARACYDCKRRKVKCTGENACQQCRNRDVRCCYTPPPTCTPPSTGEASGEVERTPSRAGSSLSSASHDQITQSLPIAGAPTALAESRIEELCDRVSALERMLRHVLKSAMLIRDPSSVAAKLQAPTRPSAPDGDDNSNQFDTRAAPHDSLALSSQVAAMSALLSRPASPRLDSGMLNSEVEVVIELPEPHSLHHLLDVYFRDMNNYFPFLDREEIEPRFHEIIRRLGYSSYNRILVVPVEDLSIFALVCIMLALAECLDSGGGICDGETKPGRESYIQSCRAIQCLSNSKIVLNLNVVRAQCLVAAYLMHCETLTAASKAVFVTWQLATSIRLNNKKAWPGGDAEGTLQRQRLWWTIYFLDRQISRRSGTTYHVRDTEFDVDDFTPKEGTIDGISGIRSNWYSSIAASYLQALISSARLWGNVWDTFFAVGATKRGDWMEVEIMDARILNTRRQLPSRLTWNSDELATYMRDGEDELHIRRRLQVFTRSELLRMLIRQNPVCQAVFNTETSHLCARLSREIIKAHDLYVSHYPEARAIGYFTTSSTVECIYHLALVMHNSNDQAEHAACVSAFNQAHGILVRLSVYNKVAKRALKALNGVVRKWGGNIYAGADRYVHINACRDGLVNRDTPDTISQARDFQAFSMPSEGESRGDDFSEWMNVNMDSLFGHDFDRLPDLQM